MSACSIARSSERVLVLVRGTRDAEVTRDLLVREGLEAFVCSNVADLAERMAEGAGAALIEEEVLRAGAGLEPLIDGLRRQPPWSDFPIVVFSGRHEIERSSAPLLGNVTFLDRPVRTRTMLASVHGAIRGRRRQYEARRAIEARDTFLAMLGHELRNPLGAIQLALAMLDRKMALSTRPKELAIVERQARHLTHLVNDLLDVARVTQGKVTLERERLNVVEAARSAFDALEERARAQGLTYLFDAPQGAVWVNGDRHRLEQVLSNLLTNAIKYTPPGGSVATSVAAEGAEAVVRVTDTGLGIAPDMIGRLFEAFAQADRTLARTEGGIGLGLALVRSLVQLHGGSVEGRSDGPNRGSTFTARLPLAEGAVVGEAPSANGLDAPPGATRRVVVVEDSADIRELLVEMLVEDGHDVACAEDGPGGLAAMLASPPDIAFIDLGLPGFDGLELARRARASGLRSRLVAVTGYGQQEDRARALGAGFDDHITKPVVDTDLRRLMHGLG